MSRRRTVGTSVHEDVIDPARVDSRLVGLVLVVALAMVASLLSPAFAGTDADLGVVVAVTPDPVTVGQPLSVEVEVSNAGPDGATGVGVDVGLPAGTTAGTLPAGCTVTGQVVSCDVGALAADGSQTLQLSVFPTVVGQHLLNIAVDGDQDDPNEANNTTTANTIVLAAEEPPSDDCFALLAGRTIDAGQVCLTRTDEGLLVTVETDQGWVLEASHAAVAADPGGIPQTKAPAGQGFGNPIPGRFQSGFGQLSDALIVHHLLPLNDLQDAPSIVVAVHADVRRGEQTESAWAAGERFTVRGSWATYIAW